MWLLRLNGHYGGGYLFMSSCAGVPPLRSGASIARTTIGYRYHLFDLIIRLYIYGEYSPTIMFVSNIY